MMKRLIAAGIGFALLAGGGFWMWRQTPESAPAAKPSDSGRDCTSIIERIYETSDCQAKLALYAQNIKYCADRYIELEDSEAYETVFADEIFEITRCFRDKGDAKGERDSLEYALQNANWQVNGPGGCTGHGVARAELEALTRETPQPCVSEAQLRSELDKVFSPFAPEKLTRFFGRGSVLSFGALDSDDACPATADEIRATLTKAFGSDTRLVVQKQESYDVNVRAYLGKTSMSEPRLILDFTSAKGCLLLSNVMAPAGEK